MPYRGSEKEREAKRRYKRSPRGQMLKKKDDLKYAASAKGKKTRQQAWEAFKSRKPQPLFPKTSCFYCARIPPTGIQNLQRDHVVPLSKGGLDVSENIVWACADCNFWKKNKSASSLLNQLLNVGTITPDMYFFRKEALFRGNCR